MNISSKQLRIISAATVRRHATDLQRSIDRRVDTHGSRDAPLARLRALRDFVVEQCEAIGPSGRYLASEIDFTAAHLRSEGERGASYDENRAEALLYAAAALGALWFIDSRLLDPRDFSPASGPSDKRQGLLAVDLGTRFERASALAKSRSSAVLHGLRDASNEACSSASLRVLSERVFAADRHEALTHFMGAEKQLLQRAEIAAPQLQALCLAGDLAFGMGRCARLLSQFCPTDAADQRVKVLTGIINGLVDEAQR